MGTCSLISMCWIVVNLFFKYHYDDLIHTGSRVAKECFSCVCFKTREGFVSYAESKYICVPFLREAVLHLLRGDCLSLKFGSYMEPKSLCLLRGEVFVSYVESK